MRKDHGEAKTIEAGRVDGPSERGEPPFGALVYSLWSLSEGFEEVCEGLDGTGNQTPALAHYASMTVRRASSASSISVAPIPWCVSIRKRAGPVWERSTPFSPRRSMNASSVTRRSRRSM